MKKLGYFSKNTYKKDKELNRPVNENLSTPD